MFKFIPSVLFSFILIGNASALSCDLAENFSPNKNPNGAWSYGFSSTIGGNFTLAIRNTMDALTITKNGGFFE